MLYRSLFKYSRQVIFLKTPVYNQIIGYFITYIGPLALVLLLTMLKEAYDDWERYKRDKEANSAKYAYEVLIYL